MSLTPPIGANGIYKLSAPYQNLLVPNVSYTCVAVRKMSDILKLSIDPHRTYYAPYSLALSIYEQDLQNGECIVSLKSSGNHWVYVPTSYIQSYPNIGGVSYTAIALGINIGSIPDYLDLSQVKQRIVDTVRETIGVTSTVQSVAISPTTLLPQSDHNAIEAARVNNITSTMTDRAYALEMKAQRDALAQRIGELEQYIQDNFVV